MQHAPDLLQLQLQPLCIVSAQAVLAHISKSLCLLYRPVWHTFSPNAQVLLSGQPIHHYAGQYYDLNCSAPRHNACNFEPLSQTLVRAGSQAHPGLGTGAFVNSTVYLLGLQILLKGRQAQLCCGFNVKSRWEHDHLHGLFAALCSFAGLTPAGVAHSWVLGTAIYSAFGPGGYLLVCLYFLLGSAVRPSMTTLKFQ